MKMKAPQTLNILHLLPELCEGGVERHVLDLTRGLAEQGHRVGVVSAGGRLASELAPGVVHYTLPVHRKNLYTGLKATLQLRSLALREGWEILHAHSRVPFWITWWAASLTGLPWVATAHALYSKNAGIYPLRRATAAICVSRAVQSYLEDLLPRRREIIYNGLFSEEELVALGNSWRGPEDPGEKRLLFVGRLTEIKGLQVVLDALKGLDTYPWVLDVLGEGPRQEDYLRKVKQEGWESRVFFHGFRENPGEWMQRSSCLLFPSLQEGMGRVFLEALARGVPVFASRIPALEEMVPGEDLLPPGDSETWRGMLRGFFEGSRKAPLFKPLRMPTRETMITATEALYREILVQK
jgi:glycosyltransferase involved in cell wall biosynthesis